jgi:hypothetical protein
VRAQGKAGEIPGEDPGFGCAGEGDGSGRRARAGSERVELACGAGLQRGGEASRDAATRWCAGPGCQGRKAGRRGVEAACGAGRVLREWWSRPVRLAGLAAGSGLAGRASWATGSWAGRVGLDLASLG